MNKCFWFLVIVGLLSMSFVNARVSSWDWRFQSMTWMNRSFSDALSSITRTVDYSNTVAENKWMNYYNNPKEDKIVVERFCKNYSYPVNSTIFVSENYTINGSVYYNTTNFTNITFLVDTECFAPNITNSAGSYVPAANGTKRLANLNVAHYSSFKRIVMPDFRSNTRPFVNVTPKIDVGQAHRYAMEELQKNSYPRILSYEAGSRYCYRGTIMVNYGDTVQPLYFGNCPKFGPSYNLTPEWVRGKYYDKYAYVVAGYKAQIDYLWEQSKERKS